MNKLPASTGLEWLKQGFALFRRNSGIFTMLMFIQLLALAVLGPIPLVGDIVLGLLIPSFAIAIQQACHLIDEGRPVTFGVLGTGFRKDSLAPLCRLGAVYLGAMLVLTLAFTPLIDATVLQEGIKAMTAGKVAPDMEKFKTAMLYNLLKTIIMGIFMLLLSFAPGLTYWKGMPTFKAVFYSVFAVLGALAPILTMLVAGFGMVLAVMFVITLLFSKSQLGFVVIFWFSLLMWLVLQCGIYAAYKQILGAPESEPPLK